MKIKLTEQQSKTLIAELQNSIDGIKSGSITGIFLVNTKLNGESDHCTFAAHGSALEELIGNVEKCKVEVMVKMIAEGG